MAVMLDTSIGELVIDLFVDECPLASSNFLKLCKFKYYNGCLFYNIQSNFIAQTGDPTGTGKGGMSMQGIIDKNPSICFIDEINKHRKLNKIGLVLMAHSSGENSNKSQFFITLRGEDLYDFEGKCTVLGEIAEGIDVLEKLNEVYCDEDGRPYQDIRIRHTAVLDDPFPDPKGIVFPDDSPLREYPEEEKIKRRLRYEDDLDALPQGKTEEEIESSIKKKEAQSRAIVLEMTGDLPDADAKPPAEVLFICKLNPVTRDEDLELIFSRFGVIKSCEIIRDYKTGDSLNYAFIEFDSEGACIEAYEKMNNVLIDDRRIKVDFSQSVSHLWNKYLLQPRKNIGDKSKPVATTNGSNKSGGVNGTRKDTNTFSKPSEHRVEEDKRHGYVGDKRGRSRDRDHERVKDSSRRRSRSNSRKRQDRRDSRDRKDQRPREDRHDEKRRERDRNSRDRRHR